MIAIEKRPEKEREIKKFMAKSYIVPMIVTKLSQNSELKKTIINSFPFGVISNRVSYNDCMKSHFGNRTLTKADDLQVNSAFCVELSVEFKRIGDSKTTVDTQKSNNPKCKSVSS